MRAKRHEVNGEGNGKRKAATAAVDACVKPGAAIGLGTGTTAYWAIARVGERVARGEHISAVPTSKETQRLCRELGIPLLDLLDVPELDVAIDGADEVSPDFCAIKGGGGALFRERAVALTARSFVLVITENKLTAHLGAFPLPVEVVPFAVPYVMREIRAFGVEPELRVTKNGVFLTDNGNHILDCRFGSIEAPGETDQRLRNIHGVVTTGLFVNLVDRIFVSTDTGTVRELVVDKL